MVDFFNPLPAGIYGPGITPVRNYDDSIAVSFGGGLAQTNTVTDVGACATSALLGDGKWFNAKSAALAAENARYISEPSVFMLDLTYPRIQ